MIQTFTQDPGATLDYTIDWSAWLAGDTIDASAWNVTGGVAVDSDSFTDSTARVWLSGGTVGVATATNTITTAGGRTDERTITLHVTEK